MGKRCFTRMGVILYSFIAKVSHMILQQGFDTQKGLGKSQQGMRESISSIPHPPHMGLRYKTPPAHF
jgi:hypothetical protein